MHTWRSVAAMFLFTLSTGALGVACTAKVDDRGDALETVDVAEEAETADAAMEADIEDSVLIRHTGERARCRRGCELAYVRCTRNTHNILLCEREHQGCMRRCERLPL